LGRQHGIVEEFLEEFRVFPNGSHDDMVDSTSQALLYLRDRTLNFDFAPVNMRRQSPFSLNLNM
jgi:hypothetical protein